MGHFLSVCAGRAASALRLGHTCCVDAPLWHEVRSDPHCWSSCSDAPCDTDDEWLAGSARALADADRGLLHATGSWFEQGYSSRNIRSIQRMRCCQLELVSLPYIDPTSAVSHVNMFVRNMATRFPRPCTDVYNQMRYTVTRELMPFQSDVYRECALRPLGRACGELVLHGNERVYVRRTPSRRELDAQLVERVSTVIVHMHIRCQSVSLRTRIFAFVLRTVPASLLESALSCICVGSHTTRECMAAADWIRAERVQSVQRAALRVYRAALEWHIAGVACNSVARLVAQSICADAGSATRSVHAIRVRCPSNRPVDA